MSRRTTKAYCREQRRHTAFMPLDLSTVVLWIDTNKQHKPPCHNRQRGLSLFIFTLLNSASESLAILSGTSKNPFENTGFRGALYYSKRQKLLAFAICRSARSKL